jgi:hypothetical protein
MSAKSPEVEGELEEFVFATLISHRTTPEERR